MVLQHYDEVIYFIFKMVLTTTKKNYFNNFSGILGLFGFNEMNRALGHLCAHIG